ncbi:hypothetical protein HII31_13294 [Pseudocercospora fuligena]|uniref:Chromo domain-containing protein n=1 Tax=Pseudocercospora fuligena TaxID=685502 RepID=A0A8H6VFS0_9PEZI|nr:hypothetical protein HII31_13294 [Pseudocercospora fuligena]
MAPKRKRIGQPASTPARKRTKKDSGAFVDNLTEVSATPHPHGDIDTEVECHIRSILDETATKYHIDWADHPITGESYQPTWEPKSNANQAAIDDWERQKAERRAGNTVLTRDKVHNSSTANAAPVPESGPASKKKRGRGRPRKIVESSPVESSYQPSELIEKSRVEAQSSEPEVGPEPEPEPEPEIGESQQTASGAEQSADSQRPIPEPAPSRLATPEGAVVQLSEPPSSWAKGAYERVTSSRPSTSEGPRGASDIASSAPQPRTEVLQSSGIDPVHQASGAVPTKGAGQFKSTQETSDKSLSQVVPDSQSQQDISGLTHPSQAVDQQQEAVTGAQQDDQEHLVDQEQAHSAIEEEHQQPVAQVLSPIHPNRQTQPAAGTQQARRQSVTGDQSDEPSTQLNEELAEEVAVKSQASRQSASERSEHIQSTTSAQEGETQDRIHENVPPPPGEPTAGEHRDTVTISSTEDHSGQSSRPISSIQSRTPPRTADFEPPPAGQRPLPSSRANGITPVRPARVPQPTSPVENSSSFPFQTQLPLDVQKIETADLGYSPGARAAVRPRLPPATSRDQSVASVRSPSSSPFPSLPSRPLGTLGESAPQPFGTFSPSVSPEKSNMDSASKRERVSFAAELKAKRDQRKASSRRSFTPTPSINMEQPASALPLEIRNEVAASQAAAQAGRLGSPLPAVFENTRSPSMVPAVEPSPIITKEEMNTSERYETLLPQAQNHDDFLPRQNGARLEHETTKLPREAIENTEEARAFTVPVAPSPLQRDQYQENIYYESDLMKRFLEERHPSPELIAEADRLLDRLRDIAMHPDLINPETLSQTTEPERQAKWDVKCSAKFHFLDELINRLQGRAKNTHVAIVTKGQRLPGMVENFLNGTYVPNRRLSKELAEDSDFRNTEGVRVSVVDLDSSLSADSLQAVDLVIALDASVDAKDPRIRTLREQAVEGDAWSILLTLVLPRTVEHMELCLHKNLPASVATRMLMKATKELKYESGRLEGTQAPVKDAATIIADYLDDEDATEWPLAGLSQLEELDSQTETDIDPSASHETGPSGASKRPLEEMDVDNDAAKRARQFSPEVPIMPSTINPQDIELTHVSDSLEKNTVAAEPAHSSSSTEQQLRELLQHAQDRLDEHVKALEDLQYRHEDQRKKLVEVTRERDGANNTAQLAVQRMTGSDVNNTSLRAERTQLKEALAEANKRLLEHSVPERAEFEQLRVLMEQAKIDKDKAEKRTEATQKDLEWTRSMYQDTSSRAIELANQNRDLENRLAVALNKAQAEASRAREISVQGHNKALEQENSRLRLMLENRDAALKFKDEEITRLKDSGRGRMGTRQSSVPPRSPRMGSPMKGRGSRAASPAAGDVAMKKHLHPLRQSG